MAVNVDLGFILSLVDFFSLEKEDLQLEVDSCTFMYYTVVYKFIPFVVQSERVKSDVDFVQKSLKETIVPEVSCIYIALPCTPNNHSFHLHSCQLADDFKISRSFFDVLHLAPIKVNSYII